jgi:hypothetical protein
VDSMCEALKLVPAQWRAEFVRFIEEGECSQGFRRFLEQNADCRRACELVLRADHVTARLIKEAIESVFPSQE